MKQENIEKMKEENKRILSKLNEELAKRKRYEALLKNPLIMEFLSLKDYEFFVPMSEETRIQMLKPISMKRIDSNGIYVDQGTYIRTGTMFSENEYITFPNNEEASYKAYRDLETGESENVLIKDIETFEQEHLVINFPGDKITLSNGYSERYYELQTWFFKELLTKPQREVVKSLMDPRTIEMILAGENIVSLAKAKKN